ncbi:pilus assembly protein PilZ [Clostridium sp.]|uniref:pilus assembly protein PilZ n=1 Tax=Clostridium sp. TaxID=1506 RepID=UPI00283F3DA7|nr:pilus assembly protein PilZ [Clostridium sp.]MDR3596764.1 pilus assembly protein PilZ [Clostridium sp.]
MEIIDVNNIKENDVIKFINTNKTLVDGIIKKVSKDFLGVTINTRQDSFIILNKKQSVDLILANDQKAVKCTSVILGCTQNDFEQAVIISIPKIILGINRREFTRLPIVMDMEYSPLPLEATYEKLSNVEPKYFRYFKRAYTVNISAGGVYFVVSKNDVDSKYALVSLSIKNEKIITLSEKIRTDNSEDLKHQRVAYKFNDIKTNHRQLILDFISEKCKENTNI